MLYQDGIAAGPDGSLFMIPVGADVTYLEHSRTLDPASFDAAMLPDAETAPEDQVLRRIRGPKSSVEKLLDPELAQESAQETRTWLEAGTIPGADGPLAELGESALLDLRALTAKNGAVFAGPSRQWRYVWPRDTSFVAAAFARTGHLEDALKVLLFLQDVQEESGAFEARYLPNGSGTPDDRGIQTDGTGWVLWAAAALLSATAPADRPQTAGALSSLIQRSTDHILDLTADGSRTPPPSSDYWEVDVLTVTLGTVAPLLAGLEASAWIQAERATWNPTAALSINTAQVAAGEFRTVVEREFSDDGYARSISGGDRDAAVAFTLPPYQRSPLDGADEAWRATIRPMMRPAGGISPGEGWRADGVSWTPQTALYAFAAASVGTEEDDYAAWCWLEWLGNHRTPLGAVPEKVLADGSPAAVAPLGWTSALIVLTLVELEGTR